MAYMNQDTFNSVVLILAWGQDFAEPDHAQDFERHKATMFRQWQELYPGDTTLIGEVLEAADAVLDFFQKKCPPDLRKPSLAMLMRTAEVYCSDGRKLEKTPLKSPPRDRLKAFDADFSKFVENMGRQKLIVPPLNGALRNPEQYDLNFRTVN